MVVQEEMENMVVSRPSRFKKLAAAKKSPYLQRVKPVKAAGINSDESALWEWLFDNTKSLNYCSQYIRMHITISSYNMKYPAWEIIDNMGSCENIDEIYGVLPYDLVSFVLSVLIDCGIFVMRHMESYMGQPWTGWETGLDKESVKQRGQLVDLCRMYCHDILGNALNANREKVIKRATDYMKVEKMRVLRRANIKRK
ncbi:hypothetical protein POM88_005979 [Heracleum sosnowskyi]|uniref:Uncharacterized protein n=1 Tax=Heracleum sosnowskyi TaxID=360622 RepID=A0AAD8J4J8_9APIA|nr:hypothetical protein POM88_005979 [Heracleum sosnowskyi]